MTKSPETPREKHSPADPADERVGGDGAQSRKRRRAIKEAQAIVARYVPRNRDLVGELIAERREEAARE
jgi:hypothetical protein